MPENATVGDTQESEGWSRLALAQAEFDPEVVYLNTASLGLPPRRCLQALQTVLEQWRAGMASPPAYDAPLEAARASYAALVGVDPSCVAVGSQVSVFAGLIAAALPAGSEVLTVAGEFTSIVFPFLAQARRGVLVRQVALAHLAEAVSPRTALVAVSAVQSADGRLADLDALTEACAVTGTRVLLDTTQAVGWLPVDARRFAYTTGGGYKWLLAPRGTCFFTVQPELADELIPHTAGWYAGGDRWDSLYGGPLRLAGDARRFDVSPVWHSWVAQAPALDLLTAIGPGRPACPRARPGEPVPCGRRSPARRLGDRERGRSPGHTPSAGAGGRHRQRPRRSTPPRVPRQQHHASTPTAPRTSWPANVQA